MFIIDSFYYKNSTKKQNKPKNTQKQPLLRLIHTERKMHSSRI